MVKSNAMANTDGPIVERKRDASRLLAIECAQSAIGVGLLLLVAFRGLLTPSGTSTDPAMTTLIALELALAVVAAVALLALGFRARMGRELLLGEVARLEAAHTSPATWRAEPRGGELVVLRDRHPYRSSNDCSTCQHGPVRITVAGR